MKNITIVLLIQLILLCVSSSCQKPIGSMYVIAPKGVSLLFNADSKSKKIAAIPLGENVKIISQKQDEILVDGVYGQWMEVEWKEKKGWVFGGFLREYDINKFREQAAQFYNHYYRTTKMADYNDLSLYPKLTNHKASDIEIKDVKGHYIIVSYRFPCIQATDEYSDAGAIWVYRDTLFKEYIKKGGHLLYLNKDKYVDAIFTEYVCDACNQIFVYLGSDEYTLRKVYENKEDFMGGGIYFPSLGPCEKAILVYGTDDEVGEIERIYRFDCSKNMFVLDKEIRK